MNTLLTDHAPLEIDNRERYRRILIASQQPKASHHYDLHETPASLWEIAGLTLFALVMLGGLAEAILWGLR